MKIRRRKEARTEEVEFILRSNQSLSLESFFDSLLKIREHGLQMRERSRIYPNKPICSVGQNFGSVRWQDCYAAVLILGCGLFISIFTFSVETLLKFKLNANIRKQLVKLNCFRVLDNGV